MDGILILDKPKGLTSNQALQKVKRLFGAKKAGHTGALDPLATGVLPLCFGQATKLSQYLLDANKSYRVTAHLGVTTDTGDAEGTVLESSEVSLVSESQWRQVVERFTGPQQQFAPLYSALKYQGKPLYYWARKGVEVPRKSRQVVIDSLILESYEHPFATFQVACSKGTYIRSLVEDVGAFLGCGAHVAVLRRTQAGPYRLDQAVSLVDLLAQFADSAEKGPAERKSAGGFDLDRLVLPLSSALEGWIEIRLSETLSQSVLHGQSVLLDKDQIASKCVDVAGLLTQSEAPVLVKLSSDRMGLFAIGQILSDGRVAPKRLLV